jgi:lactate dehydrogenase-like 2-hydroxyacid dehydrogenase
MNPDLLLLNPQTEALEMALEGRFSVHRWHEIQDRAGLAAIGPRVRAVVAGGHVGLPTEIAEALPNLEIVAINGVGYDRVDVDRARTHGYRVAITPDVLTEDVADLAVSLTLNLVRRVSDADRFVRSGQWGLAGFSLSRSAGKLRYGIFGMGRIGDAIARRLIAFGGSVSYCNRLPKAVPYIYVADLRALAESVDVLILTAAATPETCRVVNSDVLDALGPEGMLVNVARGALVDQEALVAALATDRLGGAALDVFEAEPLTDQALFEMPNTVLTPHIGSATVEARQAMGALVLANLDAHFAGQKPPGIII